ncbi:unnamed protein product [Polarella glacialis]|uniref:Uncharacterized protein n=1 Tax=Polarella glacialis TaxID=89957 RepID=A0A813F366_POLGL|nr:unnamed protein product [Polarella glacialis]
MLQKRQRCQRGSVAELEAALWKVRGESQQLQSEHELSRSQCVLAEQGTSELERRLRDLHAEHHQQLQLELEAQQELEASLRRGFHEVHEHRLSELNCAAEQQAALGLREQLQQLEGEHEQLQTRRRDSVSKLHAEHRQLELDSKVLASTNLSSKTKVLDLHSALRSQRLEDEHLHTELKACQSRSASSEGEVSRLGEYVAQLHTQRLEDRKELANLEAQEARVLDTERFREESQASADLRVLELQEVVQQLHVQYNELLAGSQDHQRSRLQAECRALELEEQLCQLRFEQEQLLLESRSYSDASLRGIIELVAGIRQLRKSQGTRGLGDDGDTRCPQSKQEALSSQLRRLQAEFDCLQASLEQGDGPACVSRAVAPPRLQSGVLVLRLWRLVVVQRQQARAGQARCARSVQGMKCKASLTMAWSSRVNRGLADRWRRRCAARSVQAVLLAVRRRLWREVGARLRSASTTSGALVPEAIFTSERLGSKVDVPAVPCAGTAAVGATGAKASLSPSPSPGTMVEKELASASEWHDRRRTVVSRFVTGGAIPSGPPTTSFESPRKQFKLEARHSES